MAFIDLSQPFSDGMYVQKILPRVTLGRCLTIEEHRLNVTRADFAVHSGTHVDAPRHFVADGQTIADVDLDRTSGSAVGWAVKRRGGEEIRVSDLEGNRPALQPGDIVFIHTDWSQYYSGDYDKYADHPFLSIEAAQWLLAHQVKMLAMDIPTPDMPEMYRSPGFNWPVHRLLLGHGVLIAEHLTNLHRVVGTRFRALALPLPLVGADGSPARIVADL